MSLKLFSFAQEWKESSRFESLDISERSIVFYAENKASKNHFKLLISELTEKMNLQICYVTSVKDDPIFETKNENIKPFYIGDGAARTKFFLTLKAKILIMDMPDLNTFHIKRSKVYDVHYIYIFHSMVSTHMIYRKNAFDHFDTVFCVGKHHIDEIRKHEQVNGLTPKNLLEFGYGKLEILLDEHEKKLLSSNLKKEKTILIAPSWGEHGLIELYGQVIIKTLLETGYNVILRPHPRTFKKSKKIINDIQRNFENNPNFLLELHTRDSTSFYNSDCMISDWSGVSLEYAFVLEKPVLFVDVLKKINNHDYTELGITPLEEKIRTEIGSIIQPTQLSDIALHVENLWKKHDELNQNIKLIKSKTVFNIGSSKKIGSKYIMDLLTKNMIAD